ncbi:hypothetical protein GQ53DRAFT_753000 [Thozetella sp. PMI_491]|nr:hypothetical protein GQ53DRAFT_753000 [Thozetella sp. PMI_491]
MGADAARTASAPSSMSKRKASALLEDGPVGGEHDDSYNYDPRPKQKTRKRKNDEDEPIVEKRLRKYRLQPPKSLEEVYNRALTQKFFVLSRTRCGTVECPEELVELTGSTGNIYNVVIARQPACDCPHALAGNQCKHILFVLSRVLRAKYEYVYQLALLSTELQDIFAKAPPPLDPAAESGKDDNRKTVDGDCPICFDAMDADGREPIVWCRAACGQNIHMACFETWAATKRRQSGGEVTCPYCRSVWQGDNSILESVKKGGRVTSEGYVNVAGELGISTQRDYSTYSRFWSGHPSAYRRRSGR